MKKNAEMMNLKTIEPTNKSLFFEKIDIIDIFIGIINYK